jgi:tRNA dimethylallyltransferase
LVGPTAVGKTAVALKLAQVVGADSLQIYRELNIGTAKPTAAERARVPHHLLDVVDPPESYDAARYCRDGRGVLAQLHRRGVPPLVVGGTGLYLKALLYGLFPEGSPSGGVREGLRREVQGLGLHPHDTYRILRALEVIAATGWPVSELWRAHRFQDCPYEVLKLGLNLPREELNRRIETRVSVMLALGWLEEVEGLLSRYPADLKPLKAIGYRHLSNFLLKRWSWEEALELLKRDTRRYAKRQLTWFRADPEVKWFHPEQAAEMLAGLQNFFRG